jgi:hypothetical protein
MDRAGAEAELDRRQGTAGKASPSNRYLRSLLVVGALSVIRRAKQMGYTRRAWLAELSPPAAKADSEKATTKAVASTRLAIVGLFMSS